MIYIWGIINNYPESMWGVWNQEKSGFGYVFERHKIVGDEVGVPIITFKKPIAKIKKYDSLITDTLLPIVNKKMRDILDKICPNDVQYCDVDINCQDGKLEGYKIVNILSSVKAIDHDKSKYSYIHGTNDTAIMGFQHLALKQNALSNAKCHFARELEYSVHILISDTLANEFKKNKVTGVSFYTIEKYNNIGYI